MKRTPLKRKKPMKRTGFKPVWWERKLAKNQPHSPFSNSKKPMKRKKPFGKKPRKAMRKMSQSRKTEMRKYYDAYASWISDPKNQQCAVCIVLVSMGEMIVINPTTERHHQRGRRGALLNWRPGWIPCCRKHREWPHDPANRELAEATGIISTRTEFNTYPDELRK